MAIMPRIKGNNMEKTLIKLAASRGNKTLPILQHVLSNNGNLYATDLGMWLSTPTTLPDGVYETTELAKASLTKASPAVSTDHVIDDFPMPHEMPLGFKHTNFDPKKVSFALHAMSKNDIRCQLNGLCFDLAKGSVIATDGHRLVLSPCFDPIADGGQYIVPSEAITLAVKLGFNSVSFTTDRATFRKEGSKDVINTKLIDRVFPDYTRVIPDYRTTTPLPGLYEAIKPIKAMKRALKLKNSPLLFDDSKIVLYDDKKTVSDWPLNGAAPFPISFQSQYITDAIETLGPDAVISFGDKNSSIRIDANGIIAVIMPVRL